VSRSIPISRPAVSDRFSLTLPTGGCRDAAIKARKKTRSGAKSLWGATMDAETDAETDPDGQVRE
jgi:hypothetical protein